MLFSKLTRSFCTLQITLLSLLLVAQTACIRSASDNPQSPGVEDKGTADFRALEVTGTSTARSSRGDKDHPEIKTEWKIPVEKTYSFRVCLESRATNTQVPIGQKFQVIAPDRTGQYVDTDKWGCLNWDETIPFNFGGDSYYIEKRRQLVGAGTYRGTEQLRFAINPWLQYRPSEIGEEVVDLESGNLNIPPDKLVKEEASDSALAGHFSRASNRELRVEPDIRFTAVHVGDRPNGQSLDITFSIKPFIEPLNIYNEVEKQPLNSGEFRVFAQLVMNNVGQSNRDGVSTDKVILTPDMPYQELKVLSDGNINFNKENVHYLRDRISTGNVQLALQVVPINTPHSLPLQPFEGLFQIGSMGDVIGTPTVRLIKSSQMGVPFSYAEQLNDPSNIEELRRNGWVQEGAPVLYSNLEPRFVQVKQGETSTERTVIYRVSTRITKGSDNSPIVGEPFQIILADGSVYINPLDGKDFVTSDQDGQIYWGAELPHKYYEREHRIYEKVSIIHKRSNRKDTFTLALNPWDEGWTFGGDIRSAITYGDYQYDAMTVKPNKLMIDAFRYQTIRFRYVMDQYMTLNVKKAVVMALDPLVQRDTLYRGRIFEPLRDGVYLAKIALIKFYIDPFKKGIHLIRCKDNPEDCVDSDRDRSKDKYNIMKVSDGGEAEKGEYTTVIKKLIRVQAGRITTPLEFSMRDLRMMSVRSQIMVQLETIDENRLMRDNLTLQAINLKEKEYFELNPDQMTEEDRERFIEFYGKPPAQLTPAEREAILAQKTARMHEEQKWLQEFLANSREEMDATRELQHQAQRQRYELVQKIEKGLTQGSAKTTYEEFNPAISLPRDRAKSFFDEARANISDMEKKMKEHWSLWEKPWSVIEQDMENGKIALPKSELRRNMTDYAMVMQDWFDENKFPAFITEDMYERLEINNYTANPVAPIIDFDLYRNDSGLKRRTFIGPCTLVENDNMSEMRPTDTVDEKYCDRIDCGEIIAEFVKTPDNSEFEKSPHHDSLHLFKDFHVDDVIVKHIENERRYQMEMDALSQIGRYTETYNMNFVSLADGSDPIFKFKEGCSFVDRDACFVETKERVTPRQEFIDSLNHLQDQDLLERYFSLNPLNFLKRAETRFNRRRDGFDENVKLGETPGLWKRAWGNSSHFGTKLLEKVGDNIPRTYTAYAGDSHVLAAKIYKNLYRKDKDEYKDLEKRDVRRWLYEGVETMELNEALKICMSLTDHVFKELKKENLINVSEVGNTESNPFNSGLPAEEEYLLHNCLKRVVYFPESNEVNFHGVLFDRRMKVKEAGEYKHIRGMNMNVNVGIDFSVGSSNSLGTSSSIGMSDSGLLGVGAALAAGVLGANPLGMAAAGVVGATGGLAIFGRSSSKSDDIAISQGQSMSAATFLVVQKADFSIQIKKHEKCLNISLGRELTTALDPERLGLKEGHHILHKKVQDVLKKGFFICEGQDAMIAEESTEDSDGDDSEKKEGVYIEESYYYITQHFTAGDMLDDVNLLNHVWLLAIRGKRDFNEFIRILKSKQVDQNGEVISKNELYDYPLSRLGHVYSQVVPTFPGLYSVRD